MKLILFYKVSVKFLTDFKRAWTISKLIRVSNLSDEDLLAIGKVESLYISECRAIKSSLEKTRKILNRSRKRWRQDNDLRLSEMEETLTNSFLRVSQLMEAKQNAFSGRLSKVEETSRTSLELIDNIREYVAKNSEETRRWQEGYDWRILKNYLNRVISTLDDFDETALNLKNLQAPDEVIKQVEFLKETLEIHLEEEGLVSFTPGLGAQPDAGKDEIKASISADSEEHKVGTIGEVLRKGYQIDLGVDTKVVRKAQVSVYKKKPN